MSESKKSLSSDEIAYHQRVVALLSESQAVYSHWLTHLSIKYQLDKSDRIDPLGNITPISDFANLPKPPMP